MISFARDIFGGRDFPEEASGTLISLILKCPNPETVSQFRPIRLCNINYKVVTKILVNCIQLFFNSIISHFLSTFVPNQRAVDDVVILREALEVLKHKKRRKGLMVIKLDLEKA